MKAYVGVTDNRWAAFLRERPHLTEANFWRPSARAAFRAIPTGGPFLFKTHKPNDRLVGGGFLSGFARLRISEAWDFFGEGNGASSEAEMHSMITAYRARSQVPGDDDPDPIIGCILLRDLFFVAPDDALPAPSDWAPNLVQGRTYELQNSPVGGALEHLLARALPRSTSSEETTLQIDGPMFGEARLMVPRLGQQAFKGIVLTAYDRHCAITGSRIAPVLESAHIRPVSQQGEHRLDNGLLLRSDVHTLYDSGYLGIDEKHRLHVSPRLREDFGNGREFYDRAGTQIRLPARKVDRPAADAVTWHMDTVFRR